MELHRHFELSVPVDTLCRQAKAVLGLEREAFLEQYLITKPFKSLGEALEKFLIIKKLLNSYETLSAFSFEACKHAYTQEGVQLLELRYAPSFVQQDTPMDYSGIHQAILKGVRQAERTYPMVVGLVAILQRILPLKQNASVMDFVLEHKEDFVGVDLADNEEGFEPRPFAPLFKKARVAGLGVSVHAGEIPTPRSPSYVRDAIEHLHAQRIGHGVQSYRDPSVLELLVQQNIPLEICPVSNYLTGACASVAQHPIRKIMEKGVKVSINTDDPSIFNTSLDKEYQLLQLHHGFSVKELQLCNQVAWEHSFVPDSKKQKLHIQWS